VPLATVSCAVSPAARARMLLRRAGAKRTPAPRSGAWMVRSREPNVCAAARIGGAPPRKLVHATRIRSKGEEKTPKAVVRSIFDVPFNLIAANLTSHGEPTPGLRCLRTTEVRLHKARRLGRRASERPGVGSTVELGRGFPERFAALATWQQPEVDSRLLRLGGQPCHVALRC
jgi:hypothetical protein